MIFKDLRTGTKTNSGQLVTVADNVICGGVIIRALGTNTDPVEIRGYANLDEGGVPTARGPFLQPGDSMTIDIEDPSQVYVVMTTVTDAVRFLYVYNPPIA